MPSFHQAWVFTGGGTGGHFFPAIALAEAVRERWPGHSVAFVGARRGIEAQKLPQTQWPHLLLDVEGIAGRHPMAVFRSLKKLFQARRLLIRAWRSERPTAVIGTGGYGAAPALLAAKALGIPYFLHESNAAPGQLVKLLAKRATRVWLGMGEAAKALPGAPCREVGTPVRKAFHREFKPLGDLESPYRVLVLGGSGGAKPLNEAVFSVAERLLEAFPDWELLHQAGPREFERLNSRPRHARHQMVPFLESMDSVLEGSSLVITRSGASTCAELRATGRPGVFVPFPQSAGDHQRVNAEAMASQGRGVVVHQSVRFTDDLNTAAASLMGDLEARKRLSHQELNQSVQLCLEDLAALRI